MRRDYRHDGLPGFAFQRAAESRATFWGALRHELGDWRFYAGVIVAGALLGSLTVLAGVLS